MTKTVIEYVLSRLHDIGITDVFGVPGDYSFSVTDAICNSKNMRWIGCCNELNAAYAADGYARIKGVGALCTRSTSTSPSKAQRCGKKPAISRRAWTAQQDFPMRR